jgi:uncharacterized protein (UPF0335 family)
MSKRQSEARQRMLTQPDFKTLAAQLRDLQDATKAQIAGVMARAEEAGLDPAGLRRFVSWKRKNEEKRAQQEAIDQQCRYLAGERETPAQLPIGCELAQALNLYRRGLTVRQVAEELHVSVGKAGKLRQLSRMFAVHVHATVNTPHDPATGEVNEGNSAHEGEENGERGCSQADEGARGQDGENGSRGLGRHAGMAGEGAPRNGEDRRDDGAAERRERGITSNRSVCPTAWHEITAAREEHEARKKAERDAARERRRAAERRIAEFNARVDADPLTPPAFLDRRKVAV